MSTKVTKLPPSEIVDAKMERFFNEVLSEYVRSRRKFGPFDNGHEGYAVIKEELEEIWDIVKGKDKESDMEHELVQLAAMTFAFWLELVKGIK